MTSWVFKYQDVNVEIRGKKYKAVEPAGKEVDYRFNRIKVGVEGAGMGCGWLDGKILDNLTKSYCTFMTY